MEFDKNDDWFSFDGRLYRFETEFTEDELKEMEEKSERGRGAGAATGVSVLPGLGSVLSVPGRYAGRGKLLHGGVLFGIILYKKLRITFHRLYQRSKISKSVKTSV